MREAECTFQYSTLNPSLTIKAPVLLYRTLEALLKEPFTGTLTLNPKPSNTDSEFKTEWAVHLRAWAPTCDSSLGLEVKV